MTTLTLLIGNSDDKLTQREWARFCDEFIRTVTTLSERVHFCGGPSTWSTWQNLCMVAEFSAEGIQELQPRLVEIRSRFRQDSVAVVTGSNTVFL